MDDKGNDEFTPESRPTDKPKPESTPAPSAAPPVEPTSTPTPAPELSAAETEEAKKKEKEEKANKNPTKKPGDELAPKKDTDKKSSHADQMIEAMDTAYRGTRQLMEKRAARQEAKEKEDKKEGAQIQNETLDSKASPLGSRTMGQALTEAGETDLEVIEDALEEQVEEEESEDVFNPMHGAIDEAEAEMQSDEVFNPMMSALPDSPSPSPASTLANDPDFEAYGEAADELAASRVAEKKTMEVEERDVGELPVASVKAK